VRWEGEESEKADRRKEVIFKVHLHSASAPCTHTHTPTHTESCLSASCESLSSTAIYITENNAVQHVEWLVYTACSLLPETKEYFLQSI